MLRAVKHKLPCYARIPRPMKHFRVLSRAQQRTFNIVTLQRSRLSTSNQHHHEQDQVEPSHNTNTLSRISRTHTSAEDLQKQLKEKGKAYVGNAEPEATREGASYQQQRENVQKQLQEEQTNDKLPSIQNSIYSKTPRHIEDRLTGRGQHDFQPPANDQTYSVSWDTPATENLTDQPASPQDRKKLEEELASQQAQLQSSMGAIGSAKAPGEQAPADEFKEAPRHSTRLSNRKDESHSQVHDPPPPPPPPPPSQQEKQHKPIPHVEKLPIDVKKVRKDVTDDEEYS